MANVNVLDILMSKKVSHEESVFDSLWINPIHCYLSAYDIEALHNIATSIRLASKIDKKYKMIDDIMRARGFKRFGAGTNRVVYSFFEDDRFLVKIAVDRVGMKDNPAEYQNQFSLKPYVTKMFYTSPCGTVGFVERVMPIKNKEEFKSIAPDVFDILVNKILGRFVVEDVGTKYFMNWGVRLGEGPVLLDYPYIYKLDGNKLFCNAELENGMFCDGEIDYDTGFNYLVCSKCGKRYLATDLKDNSKDNKIIIKGGVQTMKVSIVKGNETIARSISSDEVIRRKQEVKIPKVTKKLSVSISASSVVKREVLPVEEPKPEIIGRIDIPTVESEPEIVEKVEEEIKSEAVAEEVEQQEEENIEPEVNNEESNSDSEFTQTEDIDIQPVNEDNNLTVPYEDDDQDDDYYNRYDNGRMSSGFISNSRYASKRKFRDYDNEKKMKGPRHIPDSRSDFND